MSDERVGVRLPPDQVPFVMIPNWLIDEASSMALKVYAVLMRHANSERVAWPSRQRIADQVGANQAKTIDPYIAELERLGAIAVERKYVSGTKVKAPNMYHLAFARRFRGSPVQRPTPVHGVVRSSDLGSPVERTGVDPENGHELDPLNKNHELEKDSLFDVASDANDEFDPVVHDLCNELADWVERNGSKRPTVGKRWLVACKRLIEIDRVPPAAIRAAIDWSQRDEFWCANVLSMPKLRAKYPQLRLAAKRPIGGTSKTTTNDRVASILALKDNPQKELVQ